MAEKKPVAPVVTLKDLKSVVVSKNPTLLIQLIVKATPGEIVAEMGPAEISKSSKEDLGKTLAMIRTGMSGVSETHLLGAWPANVQMVKKDFMARLDALISHPEISGHMPLPRPIRSRLVDPGTSVAQPQVSP